MACLSAPRLSHGGTWLLLTTWPHILCWGTGWGAGRLSPESEASQCSSFLTSAELSTGHWGSSEGSIVPDRWDQQLLHHPAPPWGSHSPLPSFGAKEVGKALSPGNMGVSESGFLALIRAVFLCNKCPVSGKHKSPQVSRSSHHLGSQAGEGGVC